MMTSLLLSFALFLNKIARFPATLALRNNFGLVFVQHDLRGKKLGHACNGGGEKRGGTFNYCCQGGNTVDGENWFEVSGHGEGPWKLKTSNFLFFFFLALACSPGMEGHG